jgi:hypothetical protein
MGTWHRLFGPRPTPPAIERFIRSLGETPYQWYVNPSGKLRTRGQGGEMCAITGVLLHRTGLYHGIGDWVRAADRIGLSYAEAGRILDAADLRSSNERTRRLRARLLSAARVGSTRPPRPEPDAMDLALAELVADGIEDVREITPGRRSEHGGRVAGVNPPAR